MNQQVQHEIELEGGGYKFGFRFDETAGAHTRVSLFAGKQIGSRGNCGQLTFRNEEWTALCELLRGRAS